MNYLAKMDMFLARERLGIYSWQALVTSLLVVSMPVLFVGWNLLFFCFYWTVGLVGTRADGVLVWLCFMSSSVLNAGFGVLLGAVSPNRLSLPYILSLVWNCESMTLFRDQFRNRLRLTVLIVLNVLSWALVFYSGLPSPFHYFFSVRRFCFLLLNWELINVYVTVAVSPSIPLQCSHDWLLGKPQTRVHRRRPCYILPIFWSNLLRVCRQLPRNYFWLSRRWQLNN